MIKSFLYPTIMMILFIPIYLDKYSTCRYKIDSPFFNLVSGFGSELPNLDPIPAARIIAFISFPSTIFLPFADLAL